MINTKKLKQRSDARVALVTKCLLESNGEKYECLVHNISTTGASIELNTDEHHVHVGDLVTFNVLLLSPVTYHCKVVRIESHHIGLKYFEQ